MATTKTKKNKEEVVDESKKAKTHPLIINARITEKAALGAERGTYTFNVKSESTKNEIKKAIKMIYGVTPVRVSTTKIANKTILRRGKLSIKKGGKKAVVYLKKGDKIAIV